MKKILVFLITFIALTSIVSGIYMVIYPAGTIMNLSIILLEGTPFKDFQIPGLILSIIVGGVNLLALFFMLQKNRYRFNWAMAGGIILVGWIAGQVMLIETLHWLHFIYFGIGVINVLIAYQLNGKWAV